MTEELYVLLLSVLTRPPQKLMLGFHPIQTSLTKLVPARHFYQQLLQTIDFSFVRPLFCAFLQRLNLTPEATAKSLRVLQANVAAHSQNRQAS
ncbi:hypothetical protein [uncultured Hymenobacter sp.]|uniref:hypothetical protein n=1 Tax=uncultured Hymenobacter sp. TaxID=170016 RepID=UPI0035C98AB2